MKQKLVRSFEAAILLLTIAAYCRPAHAYVDMGTGSYIVQVSIAAIAGALFSIKIFWSGIREKFRAMTAARGANAVKSKSSAGSSAPLDGE